MDVMIEDEQQKMLKIENPKHGGGSGIQLRKLCAREVTIYHNCIPVLHCILEWALERVSSWTICVMQNHIEMFHPCHAATHEHIIIMHHY